MSYNSGLTPDMLKVFETVPGMYLILSAKLTVLTASDVYLSSTGRIRSEIIGKHIFEVFPLISDSSIEIEESLKRVLKTLKPDQLPIIRFDVPDLNNKDNRLERYWHSANTPILDSSGQILYIIHDTRDVTELVKNRESVEKSKEDLLIINEELTATNENLFQVQDNLTRLNSELEERVALRTKQLQEYSRHLSFLLNAIPQQVWTAKPTGTLDYVNQIVCKDFEKSAEEIILLGWRAFIHPDDLMNCLRLWRASLETGAEYVVEFRLRMGDGSYKWYLGRAIPFIEDEKIKLWMGTNTNIDQQKNNEQKKDDFLSIASHELKTPLTSIKAFNQLMQRSKDPDKLHGFAQKSAENILRLEKLISDLLDVTKINAGKMTYAMQEFSFKQMLIDSIENVQYTALSHQIILDGEKDVLYTGDRFRIEQVINNFLTNAVKYSPNGDKVVVTCRVKLDNIIVSVQDFGIGIAAHDLLRLFERYYRVDNSEMRFEGLGLGLFISSEILKRHHGSFWIESEPGKGSTFYFRLPLFLSEVFKPVIEPEKFYKNNNLSVSYNEKKRRLDIDWTGFQSFESVQNGGMVIVDMLQKNNCALILNDNSNVLGTWSEAAEWVGEELFPMMSNAGLKYLAWIYSPSAFSQLSAKKSVDHAIGNVVVQFFTDIHLAEEWIDEKRKLLDDSNL